MSKNIKNLLAHVPDSVSSRRRDISPSISGRYRNDSDFTTELHAKSTWAESRMADYNSTSKNMGEYPDYSSLVHEN